MIVENIPDEFKKALPILEKIREAGFEAYFVGGSVRDTLLGLPFMMLILLQVPILRRLNKYLVRLLIQV